MYSLNLLIGEHYIHVKTEIPFLMSFFNKNYQIIKNAKKVDLVILINDGYGKPFVNFDVQITQEIHNLIYTRTDYKIIVNHTFSHATLFIHDLFALKHAFMNLYSSFLVSKKWGLLIHSSCVVEKGKAHLFAGHSGAGKSTAAKLSQPRKLLSDEASIVKITKDAVTVFNSPFRSEIQCNDEYSPFSLASIQLLEQAPIHNQTRLHGSDCIVQLLDKIFCWQHSPYELKQIFHLLSQLTCKVPFYKLEFKKDHRFWELIS